MTIQKKVKLLEKIIKDTDGLTVGFSGGVDSGFLLYKASELLGKKAIAITAMTDFITKDELEICKKFTLKYGIKHLTVPVNLSNIKNVIKNYPDRCYHCKKIIFTMIKRNSLKLGIKYTAEGSNADDVYDFRPGNKAIAELGIISPMKKAGLTKEEIRMLSKKAGLDTWNKPSTACLATRFPYGTEITKERLMAVKKAENYLKRMGYKQFRVRWHDDIARIEIGKDEIYKFFKAKIIKLVNNKIKKLGFRYVTLDLGGYRVGSMNEKIIKKAEYDVV